MYLVKMATFKKLQLTFDAVQCLESDGNICLITGTAFPEACHIVPFAFNSTQKNRAISTRFINCARRLFQPTMSTSL